MKCPKCEREWLDECQQSECVRRHGECIVCRFVPRGQSNPNGSGAGTKNELDDLPNYPLPPNAGNNRHEPQASVRVD